MKSASLGVFMTGRGITKTTLENKIGPLEKNLRMGGDHDALQVASARIAKDHKKEPEEYNDGFPAALASEKQPLSSIKLSDILLEC